MSVFIFESGSFHECPAMAFSELSEVWNFVQELKDTNTLINVVCCTESGEIVDPPYTNCNIPGIIEQRVDGYETPRMWTLKIDAPEYIETFVRNVAKSRGNVIEYVMKNRDGVWTVCWRHNGWNPKNWDSIPDYINRR